MGLEPIRHPRDRLVSNQLPLDLLGLPFLSRPGFPMSWSRTTGVDTGHHVLHVLCAPGWTRTNGLSIISRVLYALSYRCSATRMRSRSRSRELIPATDAIRNGALSLTSQLLVLPRGLEPLISCVSSKRFSQAKLWELLKPRWESNPRSLGLQPSALDHLATGLYVL